MDLFWILNRCQLNNTFIIVGIFFCLNCMYEKDLSSCVKTFIVFNYVPLTKNNSILGTHLIRFILILNYVTNKKINKNSQKIIAIAKNEFIFSIHCASEL